MSRLHLYMKARAIENEDPGRRDGRDAIQSTADTSSRDDGFVDSTADVDIAPRTAQGPGRQGFADTGTSRPGRAQFGV